MSNNESPIHFSRRADGIKQHEHILAGNFVHYGNQLQIENLRLMREPNKSPFVTIAGLKPNYTVLDPDEGDRGQFNVGFGIPMQRVWNLFVDLTTQAYTAE